MQDFAFVDETLDINLTQSYYLSIQVSLNGLSFSVLDPVRNKYIALIHKNISPDLIFDDYLNSIEDYLKDCELLNFSYKIVKLIWLSNKNLLVPSAFFNTKNLKQQFEFSQKLDELDEIHYVEFKNTNSFSVFTVPNQIASIFTRKFKDIQLYNQQLPYIDFVLFMYPSESKRIFVNINTDFIDICITLKGKLIFYNTFTCKTESDIIYFIMYVIEQFDLNPEHLELFLSGFINKKSSLHIKLSEFINEIKFTKPTEDFSYSYTFKPIPQHSFLNLFNLQLCV